MKLRIKFEKREPVKFISHLDLSRVFERAFRRAALPLAFSQGYTPHPKISFSAALPVGTTSSGEYMDVEFLDDINPEIVKDRLNFVLPMGIKVVKAEKADNKIDLSSVNCAIYKVFVSGVTVKDDLEKAISLLLDKEHIMIVKNTKKKTREIDIAPLIYSISLKNMDKQGAMLEMELATGQQGNVAPSVVISELENILGSKLDIQYTHREDLFLKKDDKKISPL